MRYVKFTTPEAADAYRAQLQAYHDQGCNTDSTHPKIVDCVCPTYDGQWACTLQDADQLASDPIVVQPPGGGGTLVPPVGGDPPVPPSVVYAPDEGDGAVVDTLEPPAVDEEVPQ